MASINYVHSHKVVGILVEFLWTKLKLEELSKISSKRLKLFSE
jgi:hypothetical protein